ncbi:MAG: thiamine pyrophosphate-binding protein, partial [Butyrivibrio sp.]|uniref:thiamine pyrophosphate-binding protein n=1 Tax=Butyrivibrio sp. TaxID=28121 RepID=UPI002FE6F34A|nr:thiamine pyrophosphate-binding protein [Butyrivibrio sp.]
MIKLSDYVAAFLVQHGISQVFMVVGGGAMHLDDSLAKNDGLKLLFNHHEQACSMAAESYARIHEGPACVCVTTGPGGINAMTGVAGAYLDSIPMMVISGQVRYDTFSKSTGLPLRALGDQEFDVTTSA